MLVSLVLPAHLAECVSRAAAKQGTTSAQWVADRLADFFGTTARSAADRRPAFIETDLPLPTKRAVRIAQQAAKLARDAETSA